MSSQPHPHFSPCKLEPRGGGGVWQVEVSSLASSYDIIVMYTCMYVRVYHDMVMDPYSQKSQSP